MIPHWKLCSIHSFGSVAAFLETVRDFSWSKQFVNEQKLRRFAKKIIIFFIHQNAGNRKISEVVWEECLAKNRFFTIAVDGRMFLCILHSIKIFDLKYSRLNEFFSSSKAAMCHFKFYKFICQQFDHGRGNNSSKCDFFIAQLKFGHICSHYFRYFVYLRWPPASLVHLYYFRESDTDFDSRNTYKMNFPLEFLCNF